MRKRSLRLVFFGTSSFALPTLRAVAGEHQVLVVLTQPDAPAGRGQRLLPSPVRREAQSLGLFVRTPTKLRGEFALLEDLRSDAFVVVSYGRILPESFLALPALGAFNIHPSLLPLYRGANPISAAIRDGQSMTATTIIRMDAGMDTGDILLQEPTAIEPHEVGTVLHDRLAERGADLLLEVLSDAAEDRLRPKPQVGLLPEAEIVATLTSPVRAEDLLIDWSWSAERICNVVRAYAEQPTARAWLAGERIKILACSPGKEGATLRLPGTMLGFDAEALLVACGNGVVRIQTLVPPGRSSQRGAEFARARLMECS